MTTAVSSFSFCPIFCLEGEEETPSTFSFVILARFTYTQLYLVSAEQFSSGEEKTWHINSTTSRMSNIKIHRHNSSSSSSSCHEIQPLVGKSEIQLSNNWIFDGSSRFQTFLMVQYIKMSLVLSFLVLSANGVHFWLTSQSYGRKANIRLTYCVYVSLSIPLFQLQMSANGLHNILYECY